MARRSTSTRLAKGFTLVEILVVLLIVLLVSVLVLPTIMGLAAGRGITEAARILQSALSGARDLAIRNNAPAGIRLMPDVALTDPPVGTPGAGTKVLAYSRILATELAPDYTSGKVTIGPVVNLGALPSMPGGPGSWPPPYPTAVPSPPVSQYPFPDQNGFSQQVLMIEECPFQGGFVVGAGVPLRNEPTSWFWNIRIGDKIRVNDTGSYYTVVGPCTINPITTPGANPELFVNVGLPGATFGGAWTTPLLRSYYTDNAGTTVNITFSPEFLFLVNGIDDSPAGSPGAGWVDEGWNGVDENVNGVTDEVVLPGPLPGEWEVEKWLGSAGSQLMKAIGDTDASTANTPSRTWIATNGGGLVHDHSYAILRQPVPVQGAREIAMPGTSVIDATTWCPLPLGTSPPTFAPATFERSRLPINSLSLNCDILVNANGQVVPNTIYSTPTATGFSAPFYHFWISNRVDVFAPVDQSAAGIPYRLPMPKGTVDHYTGIGTPKPTPVMYPVAADTTNRFVAGPNMLVTLYPRSGMIATNTIDQATLIDPVNGVISSGFFGTNLNQPFFDAQQGYNSVAAQ